MTTILVPALTAVGGGALGAIVTALAARRKVRAEAAAVVTDAAVKLLEEMRSELIATRAELAALREHLSGLEEQLRDHGLTAPEFVWPPKTEVKHG